MDADRFTVEAFVMLRSVFDDGTVRTIASHWDGDTKGAGWVFGVTGKKSAYKQQMLVLQVWGDDAKGKPAYEAVFSGLQMTLNRPYYVAVSVDLTDTDERGITFYARDLSNDEEPTQVYPVPHKVTRMPVQRGPFLIGATPGKLDRNWDGLIDDVRLSNAALKAKDLLVNNDTPGPHTIAFWQFEPTPGMLRDSSPNGHHLTRLGVRTTTAADTDPRRAAWADLCQVLLNANEFLYID